MALIPENNKLHHILNSKQIVESPRSYLGISQIGNKCHRKLQLYHYWAYNTVIDARTKRLFNFGKMMEYVMIADIQSVGYKVITSQLDNVSASGHVRMHLDFVIEKDGVKYILECKTHNDKSFNDVKKKGVKESQPGYYWQIQGYMGYFKIYKALYLGYNKNNSEYYTEEIDFDQEVFSDIKRKEMEILMAEVLLPRIGTNTRTWFECKMCDARYVCFGDKDVNRNCRTCTNVDVLPNGVWQCNLNNKNLSKEEQLEGCSEYKTSVFFKV